MGDTLLGIVLLSLREDLTKRSPLVRTTTWEGCSASAVSGQPFADPSARLREERRLVLATRGFLVVLARRVKLPARVGSCDERRGKGACRDRLPGGIPRATYGEYSSHQLQVQLP